MLEEDLGWAAAPRLRPSPLWFTSFCVYVILLFSCKNVYLHAIAKDRKTIVWCLILSSRVSLIFQWGWSWRYLRHSNFGEILLFWNSQTVLKSLISSHGCLGGDKADSLKNPLLDSHLGLLNSGHWEWFNYFKPGLIRVLDFPAFLPIQISCSVRILSVSV